MNEVFALMGPDADPAGAGADPVPPGVQVTDLGGGNRSWINRDGDGGILFADGSAMRTDADGDFFHFGQDGGVTWRTESPLSGVLTGTTQGDATEYANAEGFGNTESTEEGPVAELAHPAFRQGLSEEWAKEGVDAAEDTVGGADPDAFDAEFLPHGTLQWRTTDGTFSGRTSADGGFTSYREATVDGDGEPAFSGGGGPTGRRSVPGARRSGLSRRRARERGSRERSARRSSPGPRSRERRARRSRDARERRFLHLGPVAERTDDGHRDPRRVVALARRRIERRLSVPPAGREGERGPAPRSVRRASSSTACAARARSRSTAPARGTVVAATMLRPAAQGEEVVGGPSPPASPRPRTPSDPTST